MIFPKSEGLTMMDSPLLLDSRKYLAFPPNLVVGGFVGFLKQLNVLT